MSAGRLQSLWLTKAEAPQKGEIWTDKNQWTDKQENEWNQKYGYGESTTGFGVKKKKANQKWILRYIESTDKENK